jgi:RNA polymerase sigma-70 factor (ECF subfamily)
MAGASQLRFASLHDVELCGLAATGERGAFGELVRRHGSSVRGLLRRMGAEPSQADDVAQDAFITAFQRITEFRGEGTFVGWVKRIAARLYLRRIQKERRFAELTDATQRDESPAAIDGDREVAMDLDEALRSLNPAERLCVSLCFGAGLSHAEAAEALNLPLGTVKSHVKRGLDRLRARLAPGRGAGLEGRRGNG